jgi:pyruvate/2-oxoglutarate dehydrogenase complex dihydrolipoamide dehydrogenase (E3) component
MNHLELPPMDEHNVKLISHVHPPAWVNPKPAPKYNVVVIGAGAAGLITAAGCAGLGAKVALIERHLLGGDCLNVGCVPSKALIRAARAAYEARESSEFGVRIAGGVEVDFGAVMERMRRLRAKIAPNDSAARFEGLGVDVFIGSGVFTAPDVVEVNGEKLRFDRAVIATGARAALPPIPGLAEAGALTNETLFSLTELPKRFAIIGAGPIGCEMAQAFRRFGSEVFLFDSDKQILGREDPEAAAIVQAQFIREGVQLVTSASIKRVDATASGKRVTFEREGEEQVLDVDQVLVGVGRAPNVDGLGLAAAGVEYDKRGVTVSATLRTSNPRIFACGDICLPYKFTHTADATARIVIQNALFGGRKKWTDLIIPWATYTDPEIAHVGMYEREAADKGIAVQTYEQHLGEVDRAILDGETEGFCKVMVRAGSDEILGATIVAKHAGEMISELTLAMTTKTGLGKIASAIHPYPTQAEAIRRTGDAYNRTRLTPFVKKLFGKWLAWRRR